METILFLGFTNEDGQLDAAGREAITAARALEEKLDGARVEAALIGDAVAPAAATVAAAGIGGIKAATDPDLAQARYATDAVAAEVLVAKAQPSLVIAAGTSRARRALPGAAHRVEGKIDTQITGLDGAEGRPVVERWFYRQRMVSRMTREERPWFLLIEPGVFEAAEAVEGEAPVEEVGVELPDTLRKTKVVGEEKAAAGAETIRPDADLLFVAGAGWTKKQPDGSPHIEEAETLILTLLDKAEASLGSSKSLVDQSGEGEAVLSFMTHLNQVGQTGSVPRHPKGLATCCHGEEPHAVGWRFITDRRAINLDPNCGWGQGKADVLYVADSFEVLRKLNELL
jgi:electron transfer flavoprotein alpha subunit